MFIVNCNTISMTFTGTTNATATTTAIVADGVGISRHHHHHTRNVYDNRRAYIFLPWVWYYESFINPLFISNNSYTVHTEVCEGNTVRFVYRHNSWALFALFESPLLTPVLSTQALHQSSLQLLQLVSAS